MKYFITKAEYDALSPEMQAMYKASGDGFQMSITGLPDDQSAEITRLRNEVTTLLDEAKRAKADRAASDKAKKTAEEEAARKNGDIEAIEKGWAEKLRVEQEAHAATKTRYNGQLTKLMVTNEASALSRKLFKDNADALQHWVEGRLQLEEAADGTFKTRILDKDGKASALTIEELSNEMRANPMFKPFIKDTDSTSVDDLKKKDVTMVDDKGHQRTNVDLARQIISEMGD